MLEPYKSSDLWMEFDRAFERFRRDFEDLLWPSELPMMREIETRMPAVDLEDRGDKYVMSAEVPGFQNDEIEINVWDSSVEISGCRETTQDEESKGYVRKERSSESFYRRMDLPEEVKVENAEANLKNGILELVLPKKSAEKEKESIDKIEKYTPLFLFLCHASAQLRFNSLPMLYVHFFRCFLLHVLPEFLFRYALF
jgi:HSP20 family protein